MFSTKFTDVETSLVYYGTRYYSPSQGRFINRDSIEEQGGLNLYAFCRNNSVNGWDVLGRGYDHMGNYFPDDSSTWTPEQQALYDQDERELDSDSVNQVMSNLYSSDNYMRSLQSGSAFQDAISDPNIIPFSYDQGFALLGRQNTPGQVAQVAISANGDVQLIGTISPTGHLIYVGKPVSEPGGIDHGVNLDLDRTARTTGVGAITTGSGSYKVLVHGTATGVELIDDSGHATLIDASQLRDIMTNAGYSLGTPVILISCNTGGDIIGGDGEENFAQQLARLLGADVVASTQTVYLSNRDGSLGPVGSLNTGTPVLDSAGNGVYFRNGDPAVNLQSGFKRFDPYAPLPPPPRPPIIDVVTPRDVPTKPDPLDPQQER